jgi:hypothetical protein
MPPRLLVVILDGYADQTAHAAWEYLVDAAFRFDTSESNVGLDGYYQRTFQIIKVKGQEHAWGSQILKIYPGTTEQGEFARPNSPPYLKEGGTFVFPSVHWHLSRSKEITYLPPKQKCYSTGLETLDNILGDQAASSDRGFPATQITALIGRRGAMKSHLAYYFMLCHALGEIDQDAKPKNVLLVSLRDNLDDAKHTLTTIVEQQERLRSAAKTTSAAALIQSLINDDRIEILHYAPGCISPGEFLHRILVALNRARQNKLSPPPERNTAEIVVLNGLDHLDSKFPLCAGEKVFIPALTKILQNNHVCSVIVSAEQAMGSQGNADIGPMADLILEFADVGMGREPAMTYQEALRRFSFPTGIRQYIEVWAVRVPAGHIGGQWGILGRSENGQMSFYQPKSAEI